MLSHNTKLSDENIYFGPSGYIAEKGSESFGINIPIFDSWKSPLSSVNNIFRLFNKQQSSYYKSKYKTGNNRHQMTKKNKRICLETHALHWLNWDRDGPKFLAIIWIGLIPALKCPTCNTGPHNINHFLSIHKNQQTWRPLIYGDNRKKKPQSFKNWPPRELNS